MRTSAFFFLTSTNTSSRIEWTAVFRASNRISSGTCRIRPCCTMTGANLEMRGRRPGFLGLLSPDAVCSRRKCSSMPLLSGEESPNRVVVIGPLPTPLHAAKLELLGCCDESWVWTGWGEKLQMNWLCLCIRRRPKSCGRYKSKGLCGNTQLSQNPLPNPHRPLSIQLSQFETSRHPFVKHHGPP